MVVEIPPDFGRDVERGRQVAVGVWIDGAMPQRAETIRGYIQGMHLAWLQHVARYRLGQDVVLPARVELRYRYNPDVKSLVAMVPAVIPILLLLIPAMLATLSVVREKDLGSIINFYVTPTTRLEFLLGKQLPYVLQGMLNFLLLTAARSDSLPRAVEGRFPDRGYRRIPLRRLFHRDWPVRLDHHAHTGGGTLRDRNSYSRPGGELLRPNRSSLFAGRLRPFHWKHLPDRLLHHDLPRDVFEGPRFCRPLRLVHSTANRHPGAHRAERGCS